MCVGLPWGLRPINCFRQAPWPDQSWKVRPSLTYILKTTQGQSCQRDQEWGPGLRDRLGSTLLAVQNATPSVARLQFWLQEPLVLGDVPASWPRAHGLQGEDRQNRTAAWLTTQHQTLG